MSKLTDKMLWQCLEEAEQRKSSKDLPIDVRVRSAETYAVCLREAHNRGYDYASLKAAASGQPVGRGPDFILENHGTILLLKPQNAPAKAWIAEHLAHPETQTWAGGTVIEPRYWSAIEGGIAEEGLVVQS